MAPISSHSLFNRFFGVFFAVWRGRNGGHNILPFLYVCVCVCACACACACACMCVCTYVVVVVVDHISFGGPFMFSMNRHIIFCCLILLCNGL